MQIVEDTAPFGAYRTWYRVTGDLGSGKPPLIVLHGGPGCTHDYLDNLKALAGTGRTVIHYDQLGNGGSTHLRDKGEDFWTVQLFMDELANLIDHLGLSSGYDILGQSWGSMLASEFATLKPEGLRALVLANPVSSMPLWIRETDRLRQALPADALATLELHEKAGTTDSKQYEEAVAVFNSRHACRIEPTPDALVRTWEAMKEDPTVYRVMNGPTDFPVVGTLKDWQIVDRLDQIDVPVLLVSGEFDQATPMVVQPFADGLRDVRWTILEDTSHISHIEKPEAFMKVVGEFLEEQDERSNAAISQKKGNQHV